MMYAGWLLRRRGGGGGSAGELSGFVVTVFRREAWNTGLTLRELGSFNRTATGLMTHNLGGSLGQE